MTAGANRAIGKSNRFQRRLSSQEGRAMASRVNREVVLWAAGGEIPPADPAAWNPEKEEEAVLQGPTSTCQLAHPCLDAPMPRASAQELARALTEPDLSS